MICIHIQNLNPFFCLAAEEYLLKNFADDVFMLWQSDQTVVIGKHQNLLAEINYSHVRKHNITVARRISGGGAVFHDKGNVNFAYIKNVSSPAEISFKLFTEPVVKSLLKLGLNATTSGRNDLLINELKISGNAQHVYKNRVLHHGTLLFNANLNNLGEAIKVVPGKYISKAVESNRSKVANISDFLNDKMTIEDFVHFLLDEQAREKGNSFYQLNETDIYEINNLVTQKFSTWNWNFAYSPKYYFQHKVENNGRLLQIKMNVVKGKIAECSLTGNYFSPELNRKIANKLIQQGHFFPDVKRVLNEFVNLKDEALIDAFF